MSHSCHECGDWADDVVHHRVWAFTEENAFVISLCPICVDMLKKRGIHVEEVA